MCFRHRPTDSEKEEEENKEEEDEEGEEELKANRAEDLSVQFGEEEEEEEEFLPQVVGVGVLVGGEWCSEESPFRCRGWVGAAGVSLQF